ncbi:hypothetical protein V1511DRAFT_448483, partial [Dipodascopsis uninucleata]
VNLPPKDVPCKFYMSSTCRRGNSCWFKHGSLTGNEVTNRSSRKHCDSGKTRESVSTCSSEKSPTDILVGNNVSTSSTRDQSGDQNTERTADEATADGGKDYCAICLEVPEVYGLLTNCEHIFCLSCIRKWRATPGMGVISVESTTQEESVSLHNVVDNELSNDPSASSGRERRLGFKERFRKLSKCCPLCRQSSDFVIPSSRIPVMSNGDLKHRDGDPTPLTKEEILEAYLATQKRIPCKYFEQSQYCPFEDACHYAHRVRGKNVGG